MSALTEFRDHARRLATSEHADDCMRIHRATKHDLWAGDWQRTLSCPDTTGHDPHTWDHRGMDWDCPGLCGGCSTEADRALWKRLADEIDEHLSTDDEMLWEA